MQALSNNRYRCPRFCPNAKSSKNSCAFVLSKHLDASRTVRVTAVSTGIDLPCKDAGSACNQGLREGMEDDMSTYVDDKAKAMYAAVFDG